ncbi:MAG: hypothetical protein GY830_07815 [Bacteroidetes bacterium]|nr:hypothetical protein [Bacteroidota bacterium]
MKTQAALAAKAIKKELKSKFPNVKFSVRSDNFSMGDSVNVSWINGVPARLVEEIISKYQYGSFNGMEDIYEHTNTRDDMPQSKFVSCHREISDEILNKAFEDAKEYFAFFKDVKVINEWIPEISYTAREYLLTKLRNKDLSDGYSFSFLRCINV